ncbi:mechanosensitive ion channel family protein [Calditrichota bacterium]
METLTQLLKQNSNLLAGKGVKILLILALMLVAMRLTKIISRRIVKGIKQQHPDSAEHHKRTDTLGSVVNHVIHFTILAIGLAMVLGELGVEIGPIIAAAGVLGLAVGFGAQNLVKDVIAGFFILIEDQIRVGDVVQIAGKAGLVENVNLRVVIIRDATGAVHYVPNGNIDVVTNMTKDFSYYVIDMGVAYKEDVDQVINLMKQVAENLQADQAFGPDILEPMEILGLDKFGDSALIVRARLKTIPGKQWKTGREYNRRLKMKFDEKNIEIPFPHMTLFMGTEKDGDAAPIHLKNIE